jgi:hypothetical protein
MLYLYSNESLTRSLLAICVCGSLEFLEKGSIPLFLLPLRHHAQGSCATSKSDFQRVAPVSWLVSVRFVDTQDIKKQNAGLYLAQGLAMLCHRSATAPFSRGPHVCLQAHTCFQEPELLGDGAGTERIM